MIFCWENLPKWQNENCKGCRFADKKLIGTEKPCCIYSGYYKTNSKGKCITKRGMK